MSTGQWIVMDGRARYDTDAASIYEVLCQGSRDNIPVKAARKIWKGHDVVLCFAPIISATMLGPMEYVCDVNGDER